VGSSNPRSDFLERLLVDWESIETKFFENMLSVGNEGWGVRIRGRMFSKAHWSTGNQDKSLLGKKGTPYTIESRKFASTACMACNIDDSQNNQ
jgi:hypothetical protein